MVHCLVIGYGNTLRSDDAAGQQIAELVAAWNLASVRSLAVHQLTPELAASLADAERAIFVDVYVASDHQHEVQVIDLTASTESPVISGLGHTANPRSLLLLTQQVFGVWPPSWWVLVPAVNFEFGEQCSPVTQNGILVALDYIKKLLQDNP